MKIANWIDKHPNDHLRIIKYEPAPDVIDNHGDHVCGGEGKSTIVFDSTSGDGDIPFDLYMKDVTAINEGNDGIAELEYIPDEYYFLY